MDKENNTMPTEEDLWVLVKLKESTYAINSNYVKSILLLEEEITSTASSNDVNLGIITFRDEVVPVIDLRRYTGMVSQLQEQKEFEDMLEARKHDHIHWVNELERCLQEDDKFTLATDPHQCAFGKWYDHYEPMSPTIAFHLKKLDDPHKKLHATAEKAFACERYCDQCTRETCLKIALDEAINVYMPKVVSLLDEAKILFRESHRRMLVIIGREGEASCGLLVDEVLSVESLSSFKQNSQIGGENDSTVMPYIGQKKDSDEIILILNGEPLLDRDETEL